MREEGPTEQPPPANETTTEENTVTMPATSPPKRRGVPLDPAILEHAKRLLAEGKSYKVAAAEAGMNIYTLYGLVPAGNKAQLRAAQTRLARQGKEPRKRENKTADQKPAQEASSLDDRETVAHLEDKVAVSIRAEDVPQLPRDLENKLVASAITTDSLRVRMLKVIATEGPYQDFDNLVASVRRQGDDAHRIHHVLHDLRRAGLVKFDTVRPGRANNGKTGMRNGGLATHITATDSGFRQAGIMNPASADRVRRDMTNAANQPATTTGGPVERVTVLDVHDHDTAVWQNKCKACLVYHPNGRSHDAAVESAARRPEPLVVSATPAVWDALTADTPEAEPVEDAARSAALVASSVTADEASAPLNGIEQPEFASPDETVRPNAWTDVGLTAMAAKTVVADLLEQRRVQYPVLTALVARELEREKAAVRAARYLEAAALLDEVDPDESARLFGLAQAADGAPFSAVEAEYLAFAREVGTR